MKNRVIRLETKVATAMIMASVIMGTTCTIARADDVGSNYDSYHEEVYEDGCNEAYPDDINDNVAEHTYETPIEAELVPEAPVIVNVPTISKELVPDAQVRTDETLEEKPPVPPTNVIEPIVKGENGVYVEEYVEVSQEEIEKGEYDYYKSSPHAVNQYDITPDKIYKLVIDEPKSSWNILSFPVHRKKSESIVKVLRVYEDPKWYGSERTIEYKDLATGEVHTATPNATVHGYWKIPSFYDVTSARRVTSRVRIR